jgi:two-component system cell cycle response regulator DivK
MWRMDVLDLSAWNVLAVDDEPDNLEVLLEVLSMYNATVHPAANGEEAMTLLQTLRPTMVITDLSMPDMDGYQLLHKIRRTDHLKEVPVIALTAHAMSGDKERILAAGFNGYLSKPIRLMTVVTDILASLPSLKPAPVQMDVVSIPEQLESSPVDAVSVPEQPKLSAADGIPVPEQPKSHANEVNS